jgi:site-specific DNA recombinase
MPRRYELPPLPRIAAIYSRVSSKPQDDEDKTSLDTQEAGERDWAIRNGWLVDDRFTYRERHTGEELWERPELTRLREAARARSFGVLVCHSIERLSREPIHLGIICDELARLGIGVEFVTEPLDDSPEAALIRFIKGYAGKVENERRRERQMRATRERARRGQPVSTGRAPLGYTWADASKTSLVENPVTAPIIRRIFRDYAAGMTLRALAAALTADGIPTSTGKHIWDPTVVRQILQSSIYWGMPTTLKYRSERVSPDQRAFYKKKSRVVVLSKEEQTPLPATVAPPLVSGAIAAEVQRLLKLNQQLASRSAKNPESTLLRGLVRCGLCGSTMHANSAKPRFDGSIPVRFVCRMALKVKKDEKYGGYCEPHTILAEELDAAVWAKVSAILTNPQLLEDELDHMREADPPGTADLASLDQSILALDRRVNGLLEMAQYANDSETRRDLAGQIDVLKKQKRDLQAECAKVAQRAENWESERANLQSLTDRVAHASAAEIATWGYAEKREALLGLKAGVTLFPPGHMPRAQLTIELPLRGTVSLSSGVDFVR